MTTSLRFRFAPALALLTVFAGAVPARAQWTQVAALPASPMYTVWANGDTLLAGADTCAFVSTDAGATWRATPRPSPNAIALLAVKLHQGRLYAGTFGQGVFVSDDLGATWQGFSQGLGGLQTFIGDLVGDGDQLIAATSGAGVESRNLSAGLWQPFGNVFEPQQASNVNALALGNGRLVATGGANGQVFWRDPGDPDWTISNLDNIGLHPGLQAGLVMFTGGEWLVGTVLGVFRSLEGHEPWTRFDPALGPLVWTAFTASGGRLFAAFVTSIPPGVTIEESVDGGVTWTPDETLPGAFVNQLATAGGTIFAARPDGLWRRAAVTSVPALAADGGGLHLAIAGAQPIGATARLRFELGEAAPVVAEIFDVSGRRLAPPLRIAASAGRNEFTMDTRSLVAGVYAARVTVGPRSESLLLVKTR